MDTPIVLIYEYDDATYTTLSEILTDKGYQTQRCQSQEELRQLIPEKPASFALINTDFSEKELELCIHECRQHMASKQIILMANSMDNAKQQYLKLLGVTQFLAKPFGSKELFALLQKS